MSDYNRHLSNEIAGNEAFGRIFVANNVSDVRERTIAIQDTLGGVGDNIDQLKTGVAEVAQALEQIRRDQQPSEDRAREFFEYAKQAGILSEGVAAGLPEEAIRDIVEKLGGRGVSKENLIPYERALSEITRERDPIGWARLQQNVGLAWAKLGEREAGTAAFEKSIEATRFALEVMSKAAFPKDWARTNKNLALALFRLAGSSSGTDPGIGECGTVWLHRSDVATRARHVELQGARLLAYAWAVHAN